MVDGRAPLPRIAPPYRRGVVELVEHDDDVDSGSGLAAHVEMAGPGHDDRRRPRRWSNNVETLANVPGDHQPRGPTGSARIGTPQSPGTIVCTVTGDVARPAWARSPSEPQLRAAIDEVGGGLSRSTSRQGGPLCGCRPRPCRAELLDTPLTYEDMAPGRQRPRHRRLHRVLTTAPI